MYCSFAARKIWRAQRDVFKGRPIRSMLYRGGDFIAGTCRVTFEDDFKIIWDRRHGRWTRPGVQCSCRVRPCVCGAWKDVADFPATQDEWRIKFATWRP